MTWIALKMLTGDRRRVDTRAVQVIYAADPECDAVMQEWMLVGQIVDVFVDTRSTEDAVR